MADRVWTKLRLLCEAAPPAIRRRLRLSSAALAAGRNQPPGRDRRGWEPAGPPPARAEGPLLGGAGRGDGGWR